MAHTHSIRREGVEVGALGATAVAAWFFVADLVAGQPFHTPYSLGSAVQGFFGATATASVPATVFLYTVVHYLAFMVVGIVVSAIFHAADREPSVLAGFVILFVALELASFDLTLLVEESSAFRQTAWYQIGAANLVASIVMGVFLARRHRRTIQRAAVSLRGI